MNTTNLKKYAPQARRDFMVAVNQRLNQLGFATDSKGKLTVSTPVISGSVMQIEGLSFDASLARAREKLVQRAEQMGFEALVEQMAYTWFNRLSAIRFMELHGYLDHNLRVLSPSPSKGEGRGEGFQPEILDHAQDVAADLGLDRNHIVELKLAGNKNEQLYRTLLLGQCHQLQLAMPFLFEALAAITPTNIDPETLKVLDPACGSGHIPVEAYDILKAIYEERGYRVRDIPKLILEKNLYGLDIDDRAAQLAGFALMMKAREDDRRIFTRDIKLNVLAIQSTQHWFVTPVRHSGRDCRNPACMDSSELAIHGTGCPLPGGHDEFSDNLTK